MNLACTLKPNLYMNLGFVSFDGSKHFSCTPQNFENSTITGHFECLSETRAGESSSFSKSYVVKMFLFTLECMECLTGEIKPRFQIPPA